MWLCDISSLLWPECFVCCSLERVLCCVEKAEGRCLTDQQSIKELHKYDLISTGRYHPLFILMNLETDMWGSGLDSHVSCRKVAHSNSHTCYWRTNRYGNGGSDLAYKAAWLPLCNSLYLCRHSKGPPPHHHPASLASAQIQSFSC